MIPEPAAWAIFFAPIFSFVFIALVIRPFFNRYARFSGYLAAGTVGVSFILSLWALSSVIDRGEALPYPMHHWLTLGDMEVRLGMMVDSLTAIMLVVVSGVSLMVQIYSQGYMRENSDATGQHADPKGYSRYFAFMSLFTASMLGLVLASNILMLYVFWELVGLCSYLLIGFWYHRPAAAAAAKKAFLVTRFGDVGFLIAILYLFFHAGDFAAKGMNSLEIEDIRLAAEVGIGISFTWLALGIFAGAMGKSAQFPLHVWLPDAMEGPTPVSALIHAATMVAAGVFLVARFFPVFEASPVAMDTVAIVGAFTAIFAASMGMVAFDIKRVMAYSTVSQLGYMMAALGVGAYGAAIFHLFNHAFFKALLFLGAGSVNHATGTFDMRYMGGLRRAMPWTFATTAVAAMSLAGIPPLSGFWSKDEILTEAWGHNAPAFWLTLVAVFMTAFYAFRMLFLTFGGHYRGGAEGERAGRPVAGADTHHLHESPLVMLAPMILLGVLSIGSGFFNVPGKWLGEFLEAEVAPFHWGIAISSLALAGGGILLAYAMYRRKVFAPTRIVDRIRPLYVTVSRKYYLDELYEGVIVKRVGYGMAAGALDWLDRNVVDNLVDLVGWTGRNLGKVGAWAQSGQLQFYGLTIAVGVTVIVGAFLIWG